MREGKNKEEIARFETIKYVSYKIFSQEWEKRLTK